MEVIYEYPLYVLELDQTPWRKEKKARKKIY